MSSRTSATTTSLVLLSFVVVAAIQSWPLPLHLSTHLTGDPTGDTGVYVWNTWVFGREWPGGDGSPFTTERILSLGGPADLSLHNYTVASNLLALPLQPWLGVVGAFNAVYLLNFALTGLGMFLLLRRLPQTAAAGPGVAWIGAVLFACSPFLVARGNGHFSVAAAAAVPFFVLCLVRTLDSRRWSDAVATGACVAWAAYSDPYHAIYCVLAGVSLLLARTIDVRSTASPRPKPAGVRLLDGVTVALALAVITIKGLGGGAVTLGAVTLSMRTLYTPMLVLSVLVAVRVLLATRPRIHRVQFPVRALVAPGLLAVVTASLLLAPLFSAIWTRATEGRMVTAPVLWRSSAPGADLAAVLMPNPNHPLTPDALVEWVRRQPGESVAALPWVAIVTIVLGWRRTGLRPDRTWLAIAVVFLSMSLGPFIRIAGIETLVPTPWTFARYLPFISEARMPSRMSLLVVMAVAVLFTSAVAALGRRYPRALPIVAVALAFELLAAPRTLYRAEIPPVFDVVANGPADQRVLHVPTGIKDGLETIGNFNPGALFYQTGHERPLVSGYLSRISDQRKALYVSHPVLGPLIAESSGIVSTPEERARARAHAAAFIREQRVGWVVIDEKLASESLRELVVEILHLRLRMRHASLTLYLPELDGEDAGLGRVSVGQGAPDGAAHDAYGVDE